MYTAEEIRGIQASAIQKFDTDIANDVNKFCEVITADIKKLIEENPKGISSISYEIRDNKMLRVNGFDIWKHMEHKYIKPVSDQLTALGFAVDCSISRSNDHGIFEIKWQAIDYQRRYNHANNLDQ